jgi:hypothetical protein
MPTRTLRYDRIIIRAENVTPHAAASRLRRGSVGVRGKLSKELQFEPKNGYLGGRWCFSHDSAVFASTGWPQFHLHQQLDNNGVGTNLHYEPLIAAEQPYFPSLRPALAEIVFGVPLPQLQDVSSPTLVVRLPDMRGRLASLRAIDGEIAVEIESADDRPDLRLLAAWQHMNDIAWHQQVIDQAAPGEVRLPTEGVPAEMSIALLTLDGQLLDQRGWGEQLGQAPADEADLEGMLARWLIEGETRNVEFKQDIDTDSARSSFAETLAAFANGAGGVVVLGVADDSTVIGYRSEKIADRITNLARDAVVEPVAVQVDEVIVDEKPVQIVRVGPGDPLRKPYRYRDRVMIRANATTRRATTFEIRALANENSGQHRFPLRRR